MAPFATPADTDVHGAYRVPSTTGPLLRFRDRLGTRRHPAVFGRYHLYAAWSCPWSQQVLITRALSELTDAVTVGYVDERRDGRGWAFRETEGPDEVNGFALLREAYDATVGAEFDGHIAVPLLWDRRTGTVVSNDHHAIGIDLTRCFGSPTTYPAAYAGEIDQLDEWLGPAVNYGVAEAASDPGARAELLTAFERLDAILAHRRYLVADQITEADIRLWVTLVRYDVGPNAGGAIGPRLPAFPNLWEYAWDLYQHPAFHRTTRFAAFSRPGAVQLDWGRPPGHAAPSPAPG